MMYYIDLPYGFCCDLNGNIMSKQISNAGYNCYWKQKDEINLYEFIHRINKRHSFVMSGIYKHNYNTCWIVNKLKVDGFDVIELDCNYNKVSKIGDKNDTVEVIVKNFN